MPAVAVSAVEVLHCQPEIDRAGLALRALATSAASAGHHTNRTTTYRGDAPWLVLWGPGAPARAAIMRQHIARGGHVLALDLSYWQRHAKVRVSIDAAHPSAWVLRRDWPTERLKTDGIAIRDQWNPDGPIIIAGIGRKARAQYGDAVAAWERDMIAACRRRWPTRRLVYRVKQMDAPRPPDVAVDCGLGPIDAALCGASLVITWHSNVAVDAIRQGIPVVCKDGAAAAVCPAELPDAPVPLPTSLRDRFLGNLAWFQYELPREARLFWTWAEAVLS